MKVTMAEFLADAGGCTARARAAKESLHIVDAAGDTRMICSYYEPPPPCACPSNERDWECRNCGGHVLQATSEEKEGT